MYVINIKFVILYFQNITKLDGLELTRLKTSGIYYYTMYICHQCNARCYDRYSLCAHLSKKTTRL